MPSRLKCPYCQRADLLKPATPKSGDAIVCAHCECAFLYGNMRRPTSIRAFLRRLFRARR